MDGWSALGPDLALKLCHPISSVPTWLWVSTALPGMLRVLCTHSAPVPAPFQGLPVLPGPCPRLCYTSFPSPFLLRCLCLLSLLGPHLLQWDQLSRGQAFCGDGALGGLESQELSSPPWLLTQSQLHQPRGAASISPTLRKEMCVPCLTGYPMPPDLGITFSSFLRAPSSGKIAGMGRAGVGLTAFLQT